MATMHLGYSPPHRSAIAPAPPPAAHHSDNRHESPRGIMSFNTPPQPIPSPRHWSAAAAADRDSEGEDEADGAYYESLSWYARHEGGWGGE